MFKQSDNIKKRLRSLPTKDDKASKLDDILKEVYQLGMSLFLQNDQTEVIKKFLDYINKHQEEKNYLLKLINQKYQNSSLDYFNNAFVYVVTGEKYDKEIGRSLVLMVLDLASNVIDNKLDGLITSDFDSISPPFAQSTSIIIKNTKKVQHEPQQKKLKIKESANAKLTNFVGSNTKQIMPKQISEKQKIAGTASSFLLLAPRFQGKNWQDMQATLSIEMNTTKLNKIKLSHMEKKL